MKSVFENMRLIKDISKFYWDTGTLDSNKERMGPLTYINMKDFKRCFFFYLLIQIILIILFRFL